MIDVSSARVYDLGQPYCPGMPQYPVQPPFLFGLTKAHGEVVGPAGGSSAAEAITLGGHVGTHIDALSHFSCDGKLHGGIVPTQSYSEGVREHAVENIQPILRRGFLFDVAGLAGVPRLAGFNALPHDFEITPEHLAACNVEP